MAVMKVKENNPEASSVWVQGLGLKVADSKVVPLMFVNLGSGSQIPLLRAIFRGLGTQTQGYEP